MSMMVDVAIEEGINVSHNLGGTCFYGLPIPESAPPTSKKGSCCLAKKFIISYETALYAYNIRLVSRISTIKPVINMLSLWGHCHGKHPLSWRCCRPNKAKMSGQRVGRHI